MKFSRFIFRNIKFNKSIQLEWFIDFKSCLLWFIEIQIEKKCIEIWFDSRSNFEDNSKKLHLDDRRPRF